MNFQELRLAEPIVRAVVAEGYSDPTPIQAEAIPPALSGRDILGSAQTGTGKTCAFALPILQRLSYEDGHGGKPLRRGAHGRAPRAIILAPTRELATQIYESFRCYGRNLPLHYGVVFGGVSQVPQVRTLRKGIDILVATPGRLLDLINQREIDLRSIEILVLDEADRMLDMGFITDIRKVVDIVPKERQTLFFSATVSRDIRRLADSLLSDPVRIETAPESTTVETIAQRVYMVDRKNKAMLLERLLASDDVVRSLVFTRTKYGADKLTKALNRSGIDAEAIHGDKTQNARTKAMRRFKAGNTRVLVATDIASRGIDVDEISHVFNFDMPIDAETYVHRIGRTARAGASGVAMTFCAQDDVNALRAIQRRTNAQIDIADDMQDLTFDLASLKSRPKRDQRRSGGRPNGRPNGRPSANKSRGGGYGNSNASSGRMRKPKGKGRPNSGGNRSSRGGSRG